MQHRDPFAEDTKPIQVPAAGFTFEHVWFIPQPDVIESNSDEAWAAWDAAVRAGVFHLGK